MELSKFIHKNSASNLPSNFIKKVFASFDNFQTEECYVIRQNQRWENVTDFLTNPIHDKELEKEWKRIKKNSPIPLPEDYKELFLIFGQSVIENHKDNSFPANFLFWNWDDIEFFEDMSIEDFWEECPKMLPVGHDLGDMFYIYGEGPDGLGVYWCDTGCGYYMEDMEKLADSFTKLFTNIKPLDQIYYP